MAAPANGASAHDNDDDTIQIVEAQPADAAGVAAVGARTFTETFGWDLDAADLAAYLGSAYTAAAVEAEIRDPRKTTWVAKKKGKGKKEEEEKEEVLGFAQLARGETDPHVAALEEGGQEEDPERTHAKFERLYVDGRAQGKGLGTRLLRRAVEAAAAEGFRRVHLTVWEKIPDTQRLYARHGFEKVGETGFVMGGKTHNDWVMCKSL